MNVLHFSRDMSCTDAILNAEVVHECTDVTESAAQLDGVRDGLFHTVSYYRVNYLPGVCVYIICQVYILSTRCVYVCVVYQVCMCMYHLPGVCVYILSTGCVCVCVH